MENKLKILGIGIGVLIIVNLLVLDFVWVNQQKKQVSEVTGIPQSKTMVTPTEFPTESGMEGEAESIQTCSDSCLSEIDKKIEEAISKLPTQPPTGKPAVQPTQTPSASKVAYITLGGANSTSATDWTDIGGTDFYFDLSDYPTATGVRWEISLRAFLAGNKVYARLYDVTNKRAVDYSELFTDSGTSELQRSVDLAIWRGNNLYRVQGKSSTGTPAYLDSPRLRINLE